MLNVSAIENQKIVITKSPFDLKKLIESISTMFYAQCKEKDIHFKLNLTEITEEYLFGDPMKLKEILINLISNVIKFTPKDGMVSVKVVQTSRISSMLKLRFEIADTGIGIDKEHQDKIFEGISR